MYNTESDANGNLKRLYSQENVLDVLIEFENILDSLDLYAFDNWIDGEVVSGPHFQRYWISVILKYMKNEKPDPQGAKRLQQQGIKVAYEKATETMPVPLDNFDQTSKADAYEGNERKTEKKEIWLIHIKMPRHLITDIDTGQLATDDEIIDLDDVRDAEEAGVDDAVTDEEQFGDELETDEEQEET